MAEAGKDIGYGHGEGGNLAKAFGGDASGQRGVAWRQWTVARMAMRACCSLPLPDGVYSGKVSRGRRKYLPPGNPAYLGTCLYVDSLLSRQSMRPANRRCVGSGASDREAYLDSQRRKIVTTLNSAIASGAGRRGGQVRHYLLFMCFRPYPNHAPCPPPPRINLEGGTAGGWMSMWICTYARTQRPH